MSTLRTNTITDLAGNPFSGAFSSGTTLLFYQAAAPIGWTRIDTQNNKALRVVSGTGPTGGGQGSSTGGSSGGTTAFTSVFTSRTLTGNVGDTTLTIAQIPSHTHSYDRANTSSGTLIGTYGGNLQQSRIQSSSSGSEGSGGSHTHSLTGVTMDFAVQYIDVILCSKN